MGKDLMPRDKQFIEDLAFLIAKKYAANEKAQPALANDIVEAITVCLIAKGYVRGRVR